MEFSLIPTMLVTDLPDDILREVFKFATWLAPLTIPPSKSQPPASSIISCVCKHWRALAMASPELWTDIKFLAAHHIKGPNHRGLEFLATYLRRASTRLLTFDLWNHLRGFQEEQWGLDPLENVIKPHSERVRKLRLTLTYDEVKTFLTLPSDTLAQLEELEIAGHRRFTPDNDDLLSQPMDWPDPASSTLIEFPRLKKAWLDFSRETFHPEMWRFNWSEMTTLHLYHMFMDADVALSHLRLCPLLEETSLCIRGISPALLSSYTLRDMEDVELLEMRNFSVSFQSDMAYGEFLRLLKMPKLEVLKLGNGFGYWQHQPFSKFVERSGCEIRELTVGLLGAEPASVTAQADADDHANTDGAASAPPRVPVLLARPQLEKSLRELKHLERLNSQCGMRFTPEFRGAFGKGEVLPKLRIMDLAVTNPYRDSRTDGVGMILDEFVGMVEERLEAVGKVRAGGDGVGVEGAEPPCTEAVDSQDQTESQEGRKEDVSVNGADNDGVESPVSPPSDAVVSLDKLMWDVREREHTAFWSAHSKRLAALVEKGTRVGKRGSIGDI